MKTQDSPEPKPEQFPAAAAQHVTDAHHLLQALRERLGKHPELDEAIARLEMALSVLTTNTGGML
jgi:hypothetical protein